MDFVGMTSKMKKWMLIAVLVLATPLLHAADGDLGNILQQMNAAAAKFQSAQADFEQLQYQAVVKDTDIQKGSIAFERKGTQTLMAARYLTENGKPAEKDLVFRDDQLKLYQPAIKQLSIFSAGANREQYESFLTLGFGASGDDLQKNWDVTYQGMEQLNNTKVAKLDLTPKQDAVKRTFSHVTIWVDPTRAISLKQQFFEPSGDYRIGTFTNIRYNQPIKKDVFEIKTASGTQTIRK